MSIPNFMKIHLVVVDTVQSDCSTQEEEPSS